MEIAFSPFLNAGLDEKGDEVVLEVDDLALLVVADLRSVVGRHLHHLERNHVVQSDNIRKMSAQIGPII